jgi:ribonuclease VapC
LTVFIDTSAMISMIAGESDADDLADRLEAEQPRFCSAVSVWETIAGLCREYMFSVPSARSTVQSFTEMNDLGFVNIGKHELDLAIQAYAEFGKGRHSAALNMGDCFAYACAKANRAKLLFKGDDFAKTDITRFG